MILFDCERMRYPYSGFYSYSVHLARALISESAFHTEPVGIYLPRAARLCFPEDIPTQEWHHFDKHFMLFNRHVKLFHASNQLSRYIPRRFRMKVLTTVHDLNYLHTDLPEKSQRNFHLRTRHAIRNSNRIVAISEFARQDILEHYKLGDRPVDVVHNGIDRYGGPLTAPETIPEGPFLLSLCRVVLSKNLQTLPALLEKNDFRLVIAGQEGKDDSSHAAILQEAERWGVSDRILFTGAVDEPVKHWYLQHCEAFLFPSLAEGFGLPALEAMQYHKPVFCSDRTSLPEVCGDCAFYFNHDFEPRAMQEEFEAGMAAFAAGAIPPEKMQAHLDRFTWERAARQYYAIYEQML